VKVPGLLEDIAEVDRDFAEGKAVNWRDLGRRV
jgi:hypothetical protein